MNHAIKIIFFFLGFVMLIAGATAQQETVPPAPTFDIIRFKVDGNTLLTSDEVYAAVHPYAGKNKNFADVQRALEALQLVYQKHGYGAVQVVLPEQELEKGVVHFRVIEARIHNITVQGNDHHDNANILASVPSLKAGDSPNSREIAASLRVANENPSKQTTVLLKAGEQEGEVDATIKVADEKSWKVFANGDNTGNRATGIYRVGGGFQNSNFLNLDHTFTFQYQTSPEKANDVKIFGASYHIPLYKQGNSIDITAGYSSVNSGVLQNLFNVSGRGTVVTARYNEYLSKIGDIYEHKIAYGLDYKEFRNNVTTTGGGGGPSLVPPIFVHPASVTYYGTWRLNSGEVAFNAGYSMNIPGGHEGAATNFHDVRSTATDTYHIFRYGVNAFKVFTNDIQLRAAFNGQETADSLVPGEQFGLGGFDSVRGFNEREIANDRGYRGTFEAYTPDFGSVFKVSSLRTRLLAIPFLDPFDLRYSNRIKVPKPSTQAVMFCILDVSGSMDEQKKDTAKRFFILLYLFLTRAYDKIEVVFIRHHTAASEVDENEFFHSRE
jgi:hemolysin activation/secretion protein